MLGNRPENWWIWISCSRDHKWWDKILSVSSDLFRIQHLYKKCYLLKMFWPLFEYTTLQWNNKHWSVSVLLIAVRRLHPFRNCTASTRTVSHFCHNRRHIARFVIFSYHTLVIRIFRQLLSEPRKGLSEAGVWTLLLTSSYLKIPAVNSPRYLRHHISAVSTLPWSSRSSNNC